MKKLITLIFFIVFIFSVEGQNSSFLDPLNKWNIGTHYWHDGPFQPYDYWKTSFLHVEGDTVMNGKQYFKLLICSDSLCIYESLKAYIREDSGRIFLADKTEEVLQYDFNLLQGDTMIIDLLQENSRLYYIQVDSVKNIIVQDQNTRIAQYVTVSDYYYREEKLSDVFVEGIGSLKFGLQFPFNLFVTGDHYIVPYLLCFYSSGELVYANPEINSCYLSTGVLQFRQQPELVQIFTNNYGKLELKLINSNTGKMSVFDINGKLIIRQSITHSGTQFSLPHQGIYLYRFESEKGEVQTGKVLVR